MVQFDGLCPQRKPLMVISLLYESVVQILYYNEYNMSIYRRLNLRLLVQVGDLPYTQSRMDLGLLHTLG